MGGIGMKTKELIEIINESSYVRVTQSEHSLNFHADASPFPFYTVSKFAVEINQATTIVPNMEGLTLNDLSFMITFLNQWLDTPLAEREEEKRYYLRFVGSIFGEACYLNKEVEYGESYSLDSKAASRTYQTVFTESEIEQMDITGFMKVEVSE
jgi:hypothetical protein